MPLACGLAVETQRQMRARVGVCVAEVAWVVIWIWLLVTVMREGCSMSITVNCATLKNGAVD